MNRQVPKEVGLPIRAPVSHSRSIQGEVTKAEITWLRHLSHPPAGPGMGHMERSEVDESQGRQAGSPHCNTEMGQTVVTSGVEHPERR